MTATTATDVTQVIATPRPGAAAAPPATSSAVTSSEAGGDALRDDELGRLSVFARLTVALCGFGVVVSPAYGGDPVARRILVAGLAGAAGASLYLAWMTRSARRFEASRVAVAVAVHAQATSAVATTYFFGAFSPFAALVSLAIYVYGLGASTGRALAVYLHLALGQAVLGALIITGAVADRGLVHADYLDPPGQVLVQLNIQVVFLLAFVLGRLSRRKTVAAIDTLEATVRAVALRDALLEEARQELERAAGLGEPGRFSELRLGAYQLADVIGRGAMGEIYRATHLPTGEPAAIKLLQRGVVDDPMHVARFAREARIAASICSPHVVRILEVAANPTPYIAMELLDGQDLSKLLRDHGTLSLDDTTRLVREVADGLLAAHALGVIHRDIKPQNLFAVTRGGVPRWKVLDFGVSKLAGAGTLTDGALVGTPSYMAPEQATGGRVDHRADLHALAAVAYRCLTGHPAFPGPEPATTLYAVVHRMPARPGALAPLPADLDAFFAIALAKSPADRFDEAAALARAFADACRDQLDPALRARGDALLARHPWSPTRARTRRWAVPRQAS